MGKYQQNENENFNQIIKRPDMKRFIRKFFAVSEKRVSPENCHQSIGLELRSGSEALFNR